MSVYTGHTDDRDATWQDEIDQLNATVYYFKLQLETAKTEIERLRGALEDIAEGGFANEAAIRYRARAALGDQLVDTNKVMEAKEILVPKLLDRIVELEGEREAIAKMVEESEVFCEHGCTDRIAALIRGESCDDGS